MSTGPHGRPPVPHPTAVASVPAVLALPEGRVRAHRRQDGHPGPDAVQDRDALLVRRDRHVDVAPAGQLLLRGQSELLAQPAVASSDVQRRLDGQRGCRDRRHHGSGTRRVVRRLATDADDLLLELTHLGDGFRGELQLLLLEFLLELMASTARAGALPCRALCGRQHRPRHSERGTTVRVHEQQLFFHSYASHVATCASHHQMPRTCPAPPRLCRLPARSPHWRPPAAEGSGQSRASGYRCPVQRLEAGRRAE